MEGNRSILAEMGPGDVFAEAYACARTSRLPVSVWTVQESDLLLLNVSRVISLCPSACSFHTRLVGNLLSILAEKSIRLNEKIDHLSRRTIREKLLSYLETRADREGSLDLHHPLQPAGAGGLPLRRPQRPVPGARHPAQGGSSGLSEAAVYPALRRKPALSPPPKT